MDRPARTVHLDAVEIAQAQFPSAGAQGGAWETTLRSLVPREIRNIPLDHLEASLAILDLHLFDGYVQAAGLGGPWTTAPNVPADIRKAEYQAVKAKQVDLLAGQANPQTREKPSLKSTPVPTVHVMSVPTELIVMQGEAQWAPLPPTQLLYVTKYGVACLQSPGRSEDLCAHLRPLVPVRVL